MPKHRILTTGHEYDGVVVYTETIAAAREQTKNILGPNLKILLDFFWRNAGKPLTYNAISLAVLNEPCHMRDKREKNKIQRLAIRLRDIIDDATAEDAERGYRCSTLHVETIRGGYQFNILHPQPLSPQAPRQENPTEPEVIVTEAVEEALGSEVVTPLRGSSTWRVSMIDITRHLEMTFPGIRCFHKKSGRNITQYRDLLLHKHSYGTVQTNYAVVNDSLNAEIQAQLVSSRFHLLFGNSGRGKTYFVFSLIPTLLLSYDVVAYYSPHFDFGAFHDRMTLIQELRTLTDQGYSVAFILDDCHLIDENLKRELLLWMSDYSAAAHLLMISRDREVDALPASLQTTAHRTDFNQVAEQLSRNIFEQFQTRYHLLVSEAYYNELRDHIEGSNLIFLTLLLQSWDKLLSLGQRPSLAGIRDYAHHTFLGHYEQGRSKDWRYINHIVAALFQYEIRIDRDYLRRDDFLFHGHNIQGYLADRMVHEKLVIEHEQIRPFFVFMDFALGEEERMMKHASEFRFYLEANEQGLEFDQEKNLDRLSFSVKVLRDYLLSKPRNCQEVQHHLLTNTSREEGQAILGPLLAEPAVLTAITDAGLSLWRRQKA